MFLSNASEHMKLPPKAAANPNLTRVRINNGQYPPLIIYKPTGDDDRCGNSPLPCSPYITADSDIELRTPGELASGFRLTGTDPVGVEKLDIR